MTEEQINHKPGCDALGGYGHGVGPCTCKDAAGASEGQASGMSWNGFLVSGDEKSVREVLRLVNLNGRQAQLEAEIAALRERLNAAASLNAIYADEIRDLRERIAAQDVDIAENDALIDQLRERIAGMEKDAERYRWLREGGPKQDDLIACVWGETLDRMIDDAIAKEKK